MVPKILRDPCFIELLQRFDRDLAEQARSANCPFCGGVLHSARYVRKPSGLPEELEAVRFVRESLCCASDGCRQRTLPPSVLFMGRRHFLSVTHLLLSALDRGPNARRRSQLKRMLGVGKRTLDRWRRWWADVFPKTPVCRATPAVAAIEAASSPQPRALFSIFRRRGLARLLDILIFLAPIGTPRVCSLQAEQWACAARRVCLGHAP